MLEAYHWYDYSDEEREAKQNGIVNGSEDSEGRAYTELVGENMIELPTWKYNCHAFAWYDDTVWIDYAEPFISDNHTESISVNNLQEGDIVTYWSVRHIDGEIAEYDLCLHSGIVERIEVDGTIVCRSKWGDWGLYIHDINYVPTSYCNTVMNEDDGVPLGHEIVCLFYRYTHNEHNLTAAAYPDYHDMICTDCSYSYFESHAFFCVMTDSLFTHNVECAVCGYESTEAHTWISSGTGYRCTVCGMTADSIPNIMSLPDPELEAYLASLSDEELAEFIASLPEDQAARVTALLPNGDEHLIE